MSHFTKDWFTPAEPIFRHYLKDFVGKDNIKYLEIGSFEGRSAVWMLDNILTGNKCLAVCVDHFAGGKRYDEMKIEMSSIEETFEENLKPYIGKFIMVKGSSQKALRDRVFENQYEIAYVDGSHEASDTLEDLINTYRALKVGGIMLIDDYLWNYNGMNIENTPKLAIDSFVNCFKGKISVLDFTWKTVVLKKIS